MDVVVNIGLSSHQRPWKGVFVVWECMTFLRLSSHIVTKITPADRLSWDCNSLCYWHILTAHKFEWQHLKSAPYHPQWSIPQWLKLWQKIFGFNHIAPWRLPGHSQVLQSSQFTLLSNQDTKAIVRLFIFIHTYDTHRTYQAFHTYGNNSHPGVCFSLTVSQQLLKHHLQSVTLLLNSLHLWFPFSFLFTFYPSAYSLFFLPPQYWRSDWSVHCSGGPTCLPHYCMCPLLPLHHYQTQSSWQRPAAQSTRLVCVGREWKIWQWNYEKNFLKSVICWYLLYIISNNICLIFFQQ